MRTTVDLPDELLARAKKTAALAGISLRQFLIQAVEQKLAPKRSRGALPAIGSPDDPRIGLLRPEQIDEAMFG